MATVPTQNAVVTVTPKVGVGPTTVFGTVLTIVSTIGLVIAAVKANDTATIVLGLSSLATAVATLGGRFAQAVALIHTTAPYVEQVAHELGKPDPEA